MYRERALDELRGTLARLGAGAMVIPTNDPHFGEYTQPYYKVREYLSGFTGSAGVLVVTQKSAALWTDSRYFIQAAEQLSGVRIHLMRQGLPHTLSIPEWIKEQFPGGVTVALDGELFSIAEFRALEAQLAPDSRVIMIDDPFNEIWRERPPLQFNPIWALGSRIAGESTAEKFHRFKQQLKVEQGERFVYYLSTCDDIAWLCNIRGSDIEYNLLPQSYMLITNSALHLFAQIEAIEEETAQRLRSQGVELHPYSAIKSVMASLSPDMTRVVNREGISAAHYNIFAPGGVKIVEDESRGGIVANLKAVKNNNEIEGFRAAFLYDAVAWCKLLAHLERAFKAGGKLSEYEIKQLFIEYRSENKEYICESFEPIVAFKENGALAHYSCTKERASQVKGSGFLLMDTGAHYACGGTTDTTRTIALGSISEKEKRFYTLVLKGMINLSTANFPAGTRGSSLDILARGFLYNQGVMYYHGTSHGIGHLLCVHEGPQSVRREENPVTLKPGMVISNEPAIYFEGEFGVRTENVLLVKESNVTKFGEFYGFETFTLVPISRSAIELSLLTKQEREWIDSYHQNIFEKVSPLLDAESAAWLKEATKPL